MVPLNFAFPRVLRLRQTFFSRLDAFQLPLRGTPFNIEISFLGWLPPNLSPLRDGLSRWPPTSGRAHRTAIGLHDPARNTLIIGTVSETQMGSKPIRNFLRSFRRLGRRGLLLSSPHPRPQVTARGCSRASSRVGRRGAVHQAQPPARGCGNSHPLAPSWFPHGRDPRQGPRPALTLLGTRAARRGRALPTPSGAGRLHYLGSRRLLPGARGPDVHQRQPGVLPLSGPSIIQGPHRRPALSPRPQRRL